MTGSESVTDAVVGQRALWDEAHRRGVVLDRSPNAFALAEMFADRLAAGSTILELGCGWGQDAQWFAARGFQVTASDFSSIVIAGNRVRYEGVQGLRFAEVDIAVPLPFAASSFDAVYARLSLHYFTDAQLRGILPEIARVLTRGGWLGFACKSIEDPAYGQGELIEPDMYLKDGKVRHLFSADYARRILTGRFRIEHIEQGIEEFFGQPSGFVRVLARKA